MFNIDLHWQSCKDLCIWVSHLGPQISTWCVNEKSHISLLNISWIVFKGELNPDDMSVNLSMLSTFANTIHTLTVSVMSYGPARFAKFIALFFMYLSWCQTKFQGY